MGRTIVADGSSPLTRYLEAVDRVGSGIVRTATRDLWAAHTLTLPALPIAQQRAERWWWDRWRESQGTASRRPRERRSWTSVDEVRVVHRLGIRRPGPYAVPPSRTARFVERVRPILSERFRLALAESRHDGLGAVIGPLLATVRVNAEALCSVGAAYMPDLPVNREPRAIDYNRLRLPSDLQLAQSRVMESASGLWDFLKPPQGERPSGASGVMVEPSEPEGLVAKSPSGSVLLFGHADGPIVNGTRKPTLTGAQYDAVRCLLKAGDLGVKKDDLDALGDGRRTLDRLRKGDEDWCSVICFPGTKGKGYRIK